jgi:hypothetical protein
MSIIGIMYSSGNPINVRKVQGEGDSGEGGLEDCDG